MSLLEPQGQVTGTNHRFVTITIPSLSGNGTLLSNLILSGTDQSTSAAIETGTTYPSIIGVEIRGHTAGYSYGGATSTGTLAISVQTKEPMSIPAHNAHTLTYIKNSATGTQTATAICILK